MHRVFLLSLTLHLCVSQLLTAAPGPGGQPWLQERIWVTADDRGPLASWFFVLGPQCPVPSTFLEEANGTRLQLVCNYTRRLAALQSDNGNAMSLHALFVDPVYGATYDDVPDSLEWVLLDS